MDDFSPPMVNLLKVQRLIKYLERQPGNKTLATMAKEIYKEFEFLESYISEVESERDELMYQYNAEVEKFTKLKVYVAMVTYCGSGDPSTYFKNTDMTGFFIRDETYYAEMKKALQNIKYG